MSKLLLCVLSYNRGVYLENLLRSKALFFPDHSLLIVDDSSDDPLTLAVLKRVSEQHVVLANHARPEHMHGGLYECMNKGLQYAQEQGFDYVYFVQDDMQFVRSHEGLTEELDDVFQSNADLLQVNYNFMSKISRHGLANKFEPAEPGWWQKKLFGVVDTGIVSVERANKVGLSFGKGEREEGLHYWNKGARMWLSLSPHLAWVPFPKTYRSRQSVAQGSDAGNRLFLRPRTTHVFDDLEKDAPALLEDYLRYYRKTILPYWYLPTSPKAPMIKTYIKYYLRSLFE